MSKLLVEMETKVSFRRKAQGKGQETVGRVAG
jgi:hypothetical protein